jgi:hypothetical protein
VSPWAKVFIGQGAANGTAIATTLATAASQGDTTLVVASSANMGSGSKWLNIIDTAETSSTHYTTNERVKYISGTTTITVVGQAANGGIRFDHASGVAVTNADSVYPVAYGGPRSLIKAYDAQTGEFGKTVGPKITGLADQFNTLAWKFYGGYGRLVESWILRGEYATSLDA